MQYLRLIPYYIVIALLAYMPFHIFLSQSLSMATGGLEVWKIAKDGVLIAAVLFTICLVFWKKQGSRAFWVLTGLTVAYALFHLVLWAVNPDIYGKSAALGTLLNLRVPAFAILGLGAYILAPSKFAFSSLIKIVLTISTVVVVLGLLQYVLPKDILTHAGYSIERGVRPAFFIDDNPAFPRIMSTLREPNALAAYLLLPIGLLLSLALQSQALRRRLMLGGLAALHVTALYLTHSRSAMLGVACVMSLIVIWQYKQQLREFLRRWWPVAVLGVVLLFGAAYALRNEPHIQGLVSHSTPDSGEVDDLDSNDYHWLFFKQGVEGIADQPLGHGPGTAGLASIQNPAGSFLTENYYVQIGYELGLAGLAVFIAINIWLYRKIGRGSALAVSLLASFWGLFVMNMLLHTWANETVAAQWWLMAGCVAGMAANRRK